MENPTTVITDIGSMSQLIKNFGVEIVAVAIIFVLFICACIAAVLLVKWMLKKQDEKLSKSLEAQDKTLKETIESQQKKIDDSISQQNKLINTFQEQQSTVLNSLLKAVVANQAHKPIKKDMLEESIEVTSVAEEHLRYVCGVTHCDRAAVYMFHNGTRVLNGGAHLLKTSCLIEYAILNKYYCLTRHKDIPISTIREVCTDLLKCGKYICWDISLCDENSPFKEWVSKRKVQSVVANAVYDKEGHPIGLVCCEFMTRIPADKEKQKILSEMKSLSSKMSMAMDLNLIKKDGGDIDG